MYVSNVDNKNYCIVLLYIVLLIVKVILCFLVCFRTRYMSFVKHAALQFQQLRAKRLADAEKAEKVGEIVTHRSAPYEYHQSRPMVQYYYSIILISH